MIKKEIEQLIIDQCNNIPKSKSQRTKEWRENNLERHRKSSREQAKRRRENDKTISKISNLKSKYKISLKEYELLLKKQNNVCALCNQEEIVKFKSKLKALAVDHRHSDGKIRGLLCQKCNRLVGVVENNINLVKKILFEYL